MPASAMKVTISSGCAEKSRRSEEHTSELQSQSNLVCRLLLEKKKYCRQPTSGLLKMAFISFAYGSTSSSYLTAILFTISKLPLSSSKSGPHCISPRLVKHYTD